MPRKPEHPALDDVQLPRVFTALGDQARLHIVAILADHAEHGREEFTLDIGPSALSHHMKTLREAGLTQHRFEGTRCLVSLRTDTFERFPGILNNVLKAVTSSAHSPSGDLVADGD